MLHLQDCFGVFWCAKGSFGVFTSLRLIAADAAVVVLVCVYIRGDSLFYKLSVCDLLQKAAILFCFPLTNCVSVSRRLSSLSCDP